MRTRHIPLTNDKMGLLPDNLVNKFLENPYLIVFILCESLNTNIPHQLFDRQEHKFKRWFRTQKPVLNVRVKDFCYAKIYMSQNIYIYFLACIEIQNVKMKMTFNTKVIEFLMR